MLKKIFRSIPVENWKDRDKDLLDYPYIYGFSIF